MARKGSFRELLVWQRSLDLVGSVYRLTERLPPEERYALQDQARRAAVSVPANIAEGQGRQSLSVARSSLQELETLIEIMVRLGYLRGEDTQAVEQETDEISRMVVGLMKAVRKRA